MDYSKGKCVSIGDIELHEDGNVYPVSMAVVITFSDMESFRKAIKEKQCKFTLFGEEENA